MRRAALPDGVSRGTVGHRQGSRAGTPANLLSHTRQDQPEQPSAIQSPELLMATDSIFWSETLSREWAW